jgi:hypothetical protein
MYHVKCNPTTIRYYGTTMKPEAGPHPCNRPVALESRSLVKKNKKGRICIIHRRPARILAFVNAPFLLKFLPSDASGFTRIVAQLGYLTLI